MNRYRWIFLLLCFVFPLFFYAGPDYDSPRLFKEFWNLGHLFYFAAFTVLLDSYLCSQGRTIIFRFGVNGLVLLVIGLGIELIQLGIGGRFFSWLDVLRDLSGGGIVLCWKYSFSLPRFQTVYMKLICNRDFKWPLQMTFITTKRCHRCGLALFDPAMLVTLKAVSIVLLILNLIPFSVVALDEYYAAKDFPLLAGFERQAELKRWGGNGVLSRDSKISIQGDFSAKIVLTTSQYSGVSLRYFPGDWSGWNKLVFHVYNPGSNLELHYRVHDYLHKGDMQKYDNRFNGVTLLGSGWNEVTVSLDDILNGPQGRSMDLTKIQGFGVFVIRQNEDRVIYLDNVHLQ